MHTSSQKPDDARLNALLRECRPAPDLPPGFQDVVWRRIERAETPAVARPTPDWLDHLAAWFLRPGRAFATAGVLLVLGISLGIAQGASQAKDLARERYLDSVSPPSLRQ
jgi:hypothetical protein